jgi:hypothetical protein
VVRFGKGESKEQIARRYFADASATSASGWC